MLDEGIKSLRSHRWLLSYRTSSTIIEGRPVDILHDFYLPALSLAVRYDRVAGYFRSTSLAAASQGFSSFVGRQGKMRLIVGADLDTEDVKAILAGDSQRFAMKLSEELEHPETWPEGVRSGVTLLAWMVAHGYLEVRVAFRIHRVTGEPLPHESVIDGYVHEKWFLMYDEFGNRLYGTGTLNESKTALILNAENIDIHCEWWGEMERLRVDEAAEAFEKLWQGQLSHMPVMTLPEAVRKRLIKIAEEIDYPVEIDGTSAAPLLPKQPSAMERLRFGVLRDAPKMPGGRFVGMQTAPVEPWPHQAIVVQRLVETWPYSYLLCDEVGLGKTIEAGLAFRSLYLSGLVKRIIIAAPASLTRQWHRQMAAKVLLSFGRAVTSPEIAHEYIFPRVETQKANSLYEPDMVIISNGLMARQEHAQGLLEQKPYDIALVDEAHAARRQNPTKGVSAHPKYGHLYSSIRDYLRKRTCSLWLATATPMQIDPVEVCDLIALSNRVGSFQFDPALTLEYYEILGKIIQGEDPEEDEWEFLRRSVNALHMQDQLYWRLYIKQCVIDGRIKTTTDRWLKYGRIPRGRDRQLLCRLLFSASPLSRVMLRHTRQLLEIYRGHGQLQQNLAKRHVSPMQSVKFTSPEQYIYDKLEDYCAGLARQISVHADHQSRNMVSFFLSFLRLRFASSFYALEQTLTRRLHKVEATLKQQLILEAEESTSGESMLRDLVFDSEDEDDLEAVESLLKNRTKKDLQWEREQLKPIIADLTRLTGHPSKMKVLFRILDKRRNQETRRINQIVIFTRFYDTLTDIVTRLRQVDPQIRIGTYSGQGAEYYNQDAGQMISVDREEVRERFLRREIDVLVCTDAAAEGLNLQTANLLVNFDLGWNPMKVEQRIGRIDRIGQKHKDIYVLNLCYVGSAEETVYGRLLERLAEANMIVGTQQVSLLPVTPEEFLDLAEGNLNLEELDERARERIKLQRRRTESMEIPPQELYEIYMRVPKGGGRLLPIDLDGIWDALSNSQYLQEIGCAVVTEAAGSVLTVHGINGVPEGAALTTSRELYEEGLSDGGFRLHFAAYGDPYFDAIVEQLAKFELPGCIQRIAVLVPDMAGVEVVGYAVACRGNDGLREVRLIKSWSDLQSIELAEEETLTEAEIRPLREELKIITRQEFGHYGAADRIERDNVRAARIQEMFNFMVISSLLKARARYSGGEDALFLPVLRDVVSLLEERERIRLSDLPAKRLRPVADDLLFECQIPSVGDLADFLVPKFIVCVVPASAERIADGMKVKKSKLRLSMVLARLEREAEDRWRKVKK